MFGDKMNFKKLLVLMAIFCVVISVGAVSAVDGDEPIADEGSDEPVATPDDEEDLGGYAGSNYEDQDVNTQTEDNVTEFGTDGANATGNYTGNTTINATGNVTNVTANNNATGNNTILHQLLNTGTPIIILIIVGAIIGVFGFKRKQ